MLFYASKLSNNISKTPEGYLICLNCSIARTGIQKYLGQELGIDDKYDEYVPVYRLEVDVFSPAAMASFESCICKLLGAEAFNLIVPSSDS